jgi:hypothetical protein
MASNYPPTPPAGGPPGPPPGGYPPPPPQGYQMAPPPIPPKKKTSPWLWALFGCLGLVLLIGIIIAAVGGWAVYQVKKNPTAAMTRLLLAGHPNLEVDSVDESRGIIKIRDKQTGKTLTLNIEDAKKGRLVLEGDDGERISLDGSGDAGSVRLHTKDTDATIGGGGRAKLPDWFPSYPGVTPESKFAVSDATTDNAGFEFTTSDSPARVIEFYESGLKDAGLKVSTTPQGEGAMITAEDDDRRREAMLTISVTAAGVNVDGTIKSQR